MNPKSTSTAYKMWWDCEVHGCFNKLKRLSLGVFHDCFPGKIQMSDIDGEVEVNSHWLRIEWKGKNNKGIYLEIPKGQRVNFERLTKGKLHTVIVCYGDAEKMEPDKIDVFWNGNIKRDYKEVRDINALRTIVCGWSIWAEGPFR